MPIPTLQGSTLTQGSGPTFSVVIPIKDESGSLEALVAGICDVTARNALQLGKIVIVDDGSTDNSWAVAKSLHAANPKVHAIRLRRNFGKAAALMVGIAAAEGEVIVTMDGDLQDDPEEIPAFLALIAEGNDLVSGWKVDRQDPLSKTLPSILFNRVTSALSGVRLHDFNCGFKAYRKSIFQSLVIYGDLHRYIPVLAHAHGFKIAELPVRHHARKFGHSKYGVKRLITGFIDLASVMTITRFAYRPGQLFGGIGVFLFAVGSLGIAYLIILKLMTGASIGQRPLLQLSMLLDVIGVQLMLFGMLAELIIQRSPGAAGTTGLIAEETIAPADQTQ